MNHCYLASSTFSLFQPTTSYVYEMFKLNTCIYMNITLWVIKKGRDLYNVHAFRTWSLQSRFIIHLLHITAQYIFSWMISTWCQLQIIKFPHAKEYATQFEFVNPHWDLSNMRFDQFSTDYMFQHFRLYSTKVLLCISLAMSI